MGAAETSCERSYPHLRSSLTQQMWSASVWQWVPISGSILLHYDICVLLFSKSLSVPETTATSKTTISNSSQLVQTQKAACYNLFFHQFSAVLMPGLASPCACDTFFAGTLSLHPEINATQDYFDQLKEIRPFSSANTSFWEWPGYARLPFKLIYYI